MNEYYRKMINESKIIRHKKYRFGEIFLCEFKNTTLRAVLVFDNYGNLIDSICNQCSGKVKRRAALQLNKEYKARNAKLMIGMYFEIASYHAVS